VYVIRPSSAFVNGVNGLRVIPFFIKYQIKSDNNRVAQQAQSCRDEVQESIERHRGAAEANQKWTCRSKTRNVVEIVCHRGRGELAADFWILCRACNINCVKRMTLGRAHTSAKADDPENLLPLNRRQVVCTECRGVSLGPT